MAPSPQDSSLYTMSSSPSHISPAGFSSPADTITIPPATKPAIHRQPTAKIGMSPSSVQEVPAGPAERLRGGCIVSVVSESPSVGLIHCPSCRGFGTLPANQTSAAVGATIMGVMVTDSMVSTPPSSPHPTSSLYILWS